MSISRNTTLNIVGALVPFIVSLITVPLYLEVVGLERYGALAIAWLMLGYFGLFDLGLGRATAHSIAAIPVDDDNGAITFWSALCVSLVFGAVGGLILWLASGLLVSGMVSNDQSIRSELEHMPVLLGLTVPVATVGNVFVGALQGKERFLLLNVINIFSAGAMQIAPLCVAYTISPDVQNVLVATIAARIIAVALSGLLAGREVGAGRHLRASIGKAGRLLSYGGWVTVSSVVGPLMTMSDRFVIGTFLGTAMVSIYTIPFQLAQKLLLLPTALTDAIFPRLAAGSQEDRESVMESSINVFFPVITLLVATGILGIEAFITLWLGADFASQSALIGRLLLLSFWANSLTFLPFSLLQATGRPKTTAVIHLFELPLYVAALAVSLYFFGLIGAAIAFGMRCMLDLIVISRIALGPRIPWRRIVGFGLLLMMCFGVAEAFPPFSWTWFLISVAVFLAAGLSCWLLLPSHLRSRRSWRSEIAVPSST